MQMLLNCLLVGAGGALGSIARYLLTLLVPAAPATAAGTQQSALGAALAAFPFTTLAINIAGSFAIGFIAGMCLRTDAIPQEALLFLKVGICGGFTTFSTFSLETMQLMQSGHTALALIYAVLSAIACVAAAFAGHWSACAIQAH